MRTHALGVLALVVGAATISTLAQAPAQPQRQPSPRGSAEVEVGGRWAAADGGQRYSGGKWISIDYGRPILRGRANIFGAGSDYGKQVSAGSPVWRAGANGTTRLETEVPLVFGGKTLAPGAYNVFVDLKESAWTFVLTNQPVQEKYDPNDKVRLAGAYNYDPKFDLVRVPMKLATAPVSFEEFTIGFVDMTSTGGAIAMMWDKQIATVPFTIGS
jgi:hypothetical protein